MGTRADFYIGRGKDAEWIGSLALDGYPSGMPSGLLSATTEDLFRVAVTEHLATDDCGTPTDLGWPWPWDDSGTTDYAYAFDGGVVYACCFGSPWWPANGEEPDHDELRESGKPNAVFPDMSAHKNITFGKRSGLIVVTP